MRKIDKDMLKGVTPDTSGALLKERLAEIAGRTHELLECRMEAKYDESLPDAEKKQKLQEAEDAFRDIATALGFESLLIKE